MIQLEGPITIEAQDYSDYITRTVIRRRRALVSSLPTAGNARRTQKAGAIEEEVEFTFKADILATAVWLELYDAIDTDSAEVDVVARFASGAVGADNPSFTFVAVCTGVEIGGTYGEENTFTVTMPITSAGITKATT